MRIRSSASVATAVSAAALLWSATASAQFTFVGEYPGSFREQRLGTTAPGTVTVNTQPAPVVVARPPAGATSPTVNPGTVAQPPPAQAGTVMLNPSFGLAGPRAVAPSAPAYRPPTLRYYSSTPAYQTRPANIYRPNGNFYRR